MSFVFFSAIQFVVGSLIAFATGVLLVKIAMGLFQIANARLRSFLRLIPLSLVTLDAVLNQFRIGNWLNPLRCESCLQKFLINLLPHQVQDHIGENHTSFAGWLVPLIPDFWLKASFGLIIGIAASVFFAKLFQLYFSGRSLNQIIRAAKPCERKIKNLSLSSQTQGCQIYVSDQIEIPMAVKSNTILVPAATMDALSDEEFDAVIAHEWEHLRWKDPYLKLASQMIASVFWWIPMKSWLKQLEEDQEEAADRAIEKHQLDVEDLAGAILKFVRKNKKISLKEGVFCHFKSGSSLKRMRVLFEGPQAEPTLVPCLLGTSMGALIMVSCMV